MVTTTGQIEEMDTTDLRTLWGILIGQRAGLKKAQGALVAAKEALERELAGVEQCRVEVQQRMTALKQEQARAQSREARERMAAHTITWERAADGRARVTLCDTNEVLSLRDDGLARLGEIVLGELYRNDASSGTFIIKVQPLQDAGEHGR